MIAQILGINSQSVSSPKIIILIQDFISNDLLLKRLLLNFLYLSTLRHNNSLIHIIYDIYL